MTPAQSLNEILRIVEQAPESAVGLTLYALVNTLEYERAGCLFKLTKLRELSPEQRRLAYGLMELMAERGVGDAAWTDAKARMDRAVRGV
ncbi:MAG: hypothetical protein K9L70_13155 [Thiohalocapsa sp.]|nr:hypothetical protein [Thiohalocapsa sp.]MCF7991934.1 hypothetical protein [Thiohalocapsa sp.]